jgi:hypothetical protein
MEFERDHAPHPDKLTRLETKRFFADTIYFLGSHSLHPYNSGDGITKEIDVRQWITKKTAARLT